MRTLDAVSRKSRNDFLEAGHTDGSRAQVQLSIPMSQPSFLERIMRGAAIHDPEHTLYPSDTGDKYLKQVVSPTSHGQHGGGAGTGLKEGTYPPTTSYSLFECLQ